MKKALSFICVLTMLLTTGALIYASSGTHNQKTDVTDGITMNGTFIVQIQTADGWKEAGSLSYNRFFEEKTLALDDYLPESETLRVRISQEGGGAAHMDSVFLEGQAPLDVRGVEDALKKLSRKDYDVIDVYEKSIELSFPNKGTALSLTARVEGEKISKVPFQFPSVNTFTKMTEGSAFFTYTLGSENEAPFFREYSRTGSGHPSGFTYGWVRDDGENLHVRIDFTPDNTMDGGKDYAKVYAKTGNGLKEFKVSTVDTRWGSVDFTYTDKVEYQHKVYDFTIPLMELGSKDNKEIMLAFAAYGTATPGTTANPAMAYDPVHDRYLSVYERDTNGGWTNVDILGQLLDAGGNAYGTEFLICDNGGADCYDPAIAFDSTNQRYLVAFIKNSDIYGQMVLYNGTLVDHDNNGTPDPNSDNFAITTASNNQWSPSVAFDGSDGGNERFLVVWADFRNSSHLDIYGQMVLYNGTLVDRDNDGTPESVDDNIAISTASDWQNYPSVAFGTENRSHLVAFSHGYGDIYGQMVLYNGTLVDHDNDGTPEPNGDNFAISTMSNEQYYPSVAYDSANGNYLVAWQDNFTDIYGQMVLYNGTLVDRDNDGTPESVDDNFAISNATSVQLPPRVAFNGNAGKYLVTWPDSRNIAYDYDIYGQVVNEDGSLFPNPGDSSTNELIKDDTVTIQNVDAAAGSGNDIMVAYGGASDTTIAYTLYTLPPSSSKSTLGVFRNGWWYLDSNGTEGWNEGDTSLKFGLSTDIPVAGDWNGDGTTDVGVFRGGWWYLDSNGTPGWNEGDTSFKFGVATDIPVTGDWDGNGTTDVGVVRKGWWYLDSNGTPGWNEGDTSMQFGLKNDIPVTGDWDGNGTTDVGAFRNGWWYLDSNGTPGWNEGDTSIKFGVSTDIPVSGDWDGDGTSNMGTVRDRMWYLDSNGTPGWNEGDTSIQFGKKDDIPVPGKW